MNLKYRMDGSSLKDIHINSMRFTYDEVGQVQSTQQKNGGELKSEYDNAGRVTQETDALGNATSYEYNKNGQMIKVVDALGNAAHVTDALERRNSA